MHAAIVHLTPILAAEKSKTPFYIAGGVLVAWALIVSLGLGLREAGFPRTVAAERAVMAVTAVLVVVAVSMAVATSGGSTKEARAAGSAANAGTQSNGAGQSSGSSAGASATTPSTGGTSAPAGSARARNGKAGSAAAGAQAQTKLAQAADPSGQLRFAKTTLTAKTGRVTIEFTNRSPLPHNLTIASGNTVLGATPTFDGGSKTLTLKLKPGTYKFYCSVPGHREAGMEGTLEVRQ